MFGKNKPPKVKVKLSDLCHTPPAEVERIINSAGVPAGTPKWQVTTRATRGANRSR